MMRQFALTLTIALAAIVIVDASGCSDNNSGPGGNQRMMVSSENFKIGRTDGRRDAKNSWNDSGGYWLWLWAAEETYQAGYEQGWKEGRAEAKNQQQSEEGQRLNKKHDNVASE